MREEIMAFIAEQEDIRGEKIENPIGTRDSFFTTEYYDSKKSDIHLFKGDDRKDWGENTFFTAVPPEQQGKQK